MTFYEEMAKVAFDLLKEFGALHNVRRVNTARDLSRNEVVELAPTLGQIYSVVLPASGGTVQAFDNRFFGEELVEDKMRFVISEAENAPFEISAGDEFEHEGSYWNVMGCTPLNPAGTPIIYQFGIKKR